MLRIYNIISVPSLLVHELLHIVVCLLVMSKWTGIKIDKLDTFDKTYAISFTVFTVSKTRFQNTAIHLAPLLALLIPVVMLAFNPEYALYTLIYQVITIRMVIPSDGDIIAIKGFKTAEELYEEYK